AAADPKTLAAERLQAIGLLGRGLDSRDEDIKALVRLLSPSHADDVQVAAAVSLGRLPEPKAPALLLGSWKSAAPRLRGQLLDPLLARPEGLQAILAALDKKQILPLEIDAARRQRLLDHKDKAIRARAAKLLAGTVDADRRKVVESYRPA